MWEGYWETSGVSWQKTKNPRSCLRNLLLDSCAMWEGYWESPGVSWQKNENPPELPEKPPWGSGVAWETFFGIPVLCGKDTEKLQEFPDKKRKNLQSCLRNLLGDLELPEKPSLGFLCYMGRILRNFRSFLTKNEKPPEFPDVCVYVWERESKCVCERERERHKYIDRERE